jgi:hypothetical protein
MSDEYEIKGKAGANTTNKKRAEQAFSSLNRQPGRRFRLPGFRLSTRIVPDDAADQAKGAANAAKDAATSALDAALYGPPLSVVKIAPLDTQPKLARIASAFSIAVMLVLLLLLSATTIALQAMHAAPEFGLSVLRAFRASFDHEQLWTDFVDSTSMPEGNYVTAGTATGVFIGGVPALLTLALWVWTVLAQCCRAAQRLKAGAQCRAAWCASTSGGCKVAFAAPSAAKLPLSQRRLAAAFSLLLSATLLGALVMLGAAAFRAVHGARDAHELAEAALDGLEWRVDAALNATQQLDADRRRSIAAVDALRVNLSIEVNRTASETRVAMAEALSLITIADDTRLCTWCGDVRTPLTSAALWLTRSTFWLDAALLTATNGAASASSSLVVASNATRGLNDTGAHLNAAVEAGRRVLDGSWYASSTALDSAAWLTLVLLVAMGWLPVHMLVSMIATGILTCCRRMNGDEEVCRAATATAHYIRRLRPASAHRPCDPPLLRVC